MIINKYLENILGYNKLLEGKIILQISILILQDSELIPISTLVKKGTKH